MTHAAPQLTPAQLIDAGRRAEAEGRPDLAVKFYAYLTQHFAETAEAAEAHGALGRIDVLRPNAGAHAQAIAWPALPWPLPPPQSHRYVTGRAMARLFGALGWVLALAGPAMLPAWLLLRAADSALWRAELLPMAAGAAGSLILGFGCILAAEMARAQFDQADAARDLVALQRARWRLD